MSQEKEKSQPIKSFFNTKASPAKSNRLRYSKKDKRISIKHQDEDEYKDLAVLSTNEANAERPPYPKYRSGDTSDFKSKWKTEKCRFWQINGQCTYGENCAFAHGDNEIRNRKMSASYKTKQCKQFFEAGYCTYGTRCQFSHKALEKPVFSYSLLLSNFEEEQHMNEDLLKRPRLKTFEALVYSNEDLTEKNRKLLFEDMIVLQKQHTINSIDTKDNEKDDQEKEKRQRYLSI